MSVLDQGTYSGGRGRSSNQEKELGLGRACNATKRQAVVELQGNRVGTERQKLEDSQLDEGME